MQTGRARAFKIKKACMCLCEDYSIPPRTLDARARRGNFFVFFQREEEEEEDDVWVTTCCQYELDFGVCACVCACVCV